MSARIWTEIKYINGKAYVYKISTVYTHEDYVSCSSNILREATEKDIEEHRLAEGNKIER